MSVFFDRDTELLPEEEEHYYRERRRFGRLGRWLAALALIVAVALVAAAGAGYWVSRKIDPPGAAGSDVSVNIPNGTSTDGIADQLAAEGILSDAEVFGYYVRWKDAGPFQAGVYEMQENMAMGDVIAVLDEGPASPPFKLLTIPEGLVVPEIAARVATLEQFSAEEFLAVASSGAVRSKFQPALQLSMEGLLFPDSYQVIDTDDEGILLTRMVALFDQTATELGFDQAPARVGLDPYQTIVVASLIEAEAKIDADRAKISRVIYNRLVAGMTLGIDATVYYALGRKGGALTQSDLEVDSPYNTRKYAGLPPTPIAIPGRASLEAAMNPEPGPWLFYVLADASGAHAFSDNYDQFLRDKAAAEANGLL